MTYKMRFDLVLTSTLDKLLQRGLAYSIIDKATGDAIAYFPTRQAAHQAKKSHQRVIRTKKLNYLRKGNLAWLKQKHISYA